MPSAELYFISSLGLGADIRLTSCSIFGIRKPGPEAGQPDGLELVLISVPLQGAVAIAADHNAKWRGKGTLSRYAHLPWAHTHLAEATPEGFMPWW